MSGPGDRARATVFVAVPRLPELPLGGKVLRS